MAREDIIEETAVVEDDIIELDEEGEVGDEELVYDDDTPNLVAVFVESTAGRDALKDISAKVERDYTTARDDSEESRQRRADEWKIFSGDLPDKTFPFEHCANAHVPITLENISRLQFRTMAELFGDWTNVFGVMPVEPNDEEVAEILTKHGNWQIREQIPDFQRQQARGTLIFYLNGDVTAYSYYDVRRKQNRHVILTSDEFITPYVYCTTMPDYSDCPWVGQILMYHRHELEAMRGIWYGVDEVLDREPPSWGDEPDMPLRIAEGEIQNIEMSDDASSAPYKLLQYEGWLDLPGQVRQRFTKVIMDLESGNLLSVSIHEENDWRDERRYERQRQELEQYRQLSAQYEQLVEVTRMSEQRLLGDPEISPEERMQREGALQEFQLPPPPVPPAWLTEEDLANPTFQPKPVERVPAHMYSHGVCIEALTGDKGLGFGRIESDLNKAANIALGQFLDAATLNNCKTILINDVLEPDRPIDSKPGSVIKMSGVTGTELRNNIMPLEFGPANPQLMDVVSKMYDWGQSAIQAPAVLSGEAGKSGETFRGLATRVEQATKQLSVAARNYSHFLTQILKNNARLNAIFLDDQEIIQVNDYRLGGMEALEINRDMYKRDYRVIYRSDLKFTSEAARTQDADVLVQMAMSNPILGQDLAFMHAALRKALEARGQEDLIPMLGPAPPVPNTPFGIQPPAAPPGGAPGLPPGPQSPAGIPGPGGPPPAA